MFQRIVSKLYQVCVCVRGRKTRESVRPPSLTHACGNQCNWKLQRRVLHPSLCAEPMRVELASMSGIENTDWVLVLCVCVCMNYSVCQYGICECGTTGTPYSNNVNCQYGAATVKRNGYMIDCSNRKAKYQCKALQSLDIFTKGVPITCWLLLDSPSLCGSYF